MLYTHLTIVQSLQRHTIDVSRVSEVLTYLRARFGISNRACRRHQQPDGGTELTDPILCPLDFFNDTIVPILVQKALAAPERLEDIIKLIDLVGSFTKQAALTCYPSDKAKRASSFDYRFGSALVQAFRHQQLSNSQCEVIFCLIKIYCEDDVAIALSFRKLTPAKWFFVAFRLVVPAGMPSAEDILILEAIVYHHWQR